MRGLLFVFIAVSIGFAQIDSPAHPYLLRIEHSTFQAHACALLQNSGAFHLEIDSGDRTKVFEGTVRSDELIDILRDLNHDALTNLSQPQIQEPLIVTRHDELRLNVFRAEHGQDLIFESSDSQEPFSGSLQPLVRWLDGLHKLPHRELSEDAGKNNCLPPKTIGFTTRQTAAPPAQRSLSGVRATPLASQPAAPTPEPAAASALLTLHSFTVKAGGANQSCVLVIDDGRYRFEERTQKSGSREVKTQVLRGQITADELRDLQQLLSDPALAKIGHRAPPGKMVVPVMEDLLEISISRPDGMQDIVLSSGFSRRQMGFFYGGDADISTARRLLTFLGEHVENKRSGVWHSVRRNDCQAP